MAAPSQATMTARAVERHASELMESERPLAQAARDSIAFCQEDALSLAAVEQPESEYASESLS